MRYPQGLGVQVPWVKGMSPGSEIPAVPAQIWAVFFLGEKTLKTQIFRYFSLFLRDIMRVVVCKIMRKCSQHS